jgi:hypothetical protein
LFGKRRYFVATLVLKEKNVFSQKEAKAKHFRVEQAHDLQTLTARAIRVDCSAF